MQNECTTAAYSHCLFKPWCQNPLDQAYQNLIQRVQAVSEYDSEFQIRF